MDTLFHIVLLVPLVAMIVSDFRCREVALLWLLGFGACTAAMAVYRYGWFEALLQAGGNVLLLVYLTAGVLLYFSLKERRWVNPLRNYLGLGDTLFLLCLTPLFGVREFLVFLLVSFGLTLGGWGIYRLVTRRSATIPLVGTLGISFGLYLLLVTCNW